MPTAASGTLPITTTLTPTSAAEVAEIVAGAYQQETAIYTLGGGTALDFGLPGARDGIGLSTAGMQRVLDYPARDLTITVEAGITMAQLAETLATERQFLPLDVAQADRATIGGVVATNFNGPRRYGHGTVRDYVIGVEAVDGRGRPFKGGGRVVKNVAGYDFCKLLTGSLGTLAVITQLTLKLKPRPQNSAFALCAVRDLDQAEQLLTSLVHSQTSPSAIELLAGPQWRAEPLLAEVLSSAADGAICLVVGLEGTATEVDWMTGQIGAEWREQGIEQQRTLVDQQAVALWNQLTEFPANGSPALVLKASVLPSGTTRFVRALRQIDPQVNVQAHAGNGVIIAKFAQLPEDGLSRSLVGQLHPIAGAARGNVTIWSNPSGSEMTHQSVWGGIDAPFALMTSIKRQFDPKNLLNPGRFVYT